MINNNLKIAWRTITKNKLYSTINILGLSVGLFACIMVFTIVIDDLSYDKFWPKHDRLFKANYSSLINGVEMKHAYTNPAMANTLLEQFPEVEAYSRVTRSNTAFRLDPASGEGISTELLTVDTAFITMFDIKAVAGRVMPYTPGTRNLVITESFRDKYFKNTDPVGKIIQDMPDWNPKPTSYLITAVIRDLPQNTHLRAEALVVTPPTKAQLNKQGGYIAQVVYYQLKPSTDLPVFTQKVNEWYASFMETEPGKTSFEFQPITSVYLNSAFDKELNIKNNRTNLIIFGVVGLLLLIIGCINFINLSTAKILQRLKETGVRKILGANRSSLVKLYLTESVLFFFIATVIALSLYFLLLPVAENFLGHGLTLTLKSELDILIGTLISISLLSLLIGIYPAWVISGMNPSESLRNKLFKTSMWKGEGLRKTLVVTQFSLAIVVLISLIVISSQLKLINEKDLGYEKENLLHIRSINWDNRYFAFRNEVMNIPGVLNVGSGMWSPKDKAAGRTSLPNPENPTENIHIDVLLADLNFAETVGLKLLKGRFTTDAFGTDRNSSADTESLLQHEEEQKEDKNKEEQSSDLSNILLTEYTANMLGVTEVNKPLAGPSGMEYNPIGIIQDLHSESLHHPLQPTMIMVGKDFITGIYIKTEPGKAENVKAALYDVWNRFNPDHLLEVEWMDDMVDNLYRAEQKQQTLIIIFGSMMLGLACLGVFGLIVHNTELRVKEIGIRKVLGASVNSIVQLLSIDFVKLVLISVVVASPLAWWVMSRWLDNFAFKTSIEWWMFVMAGAVALMIAILTVSIQSLKAALANPVKSLRDE